MIAADIGVLMGKCLVPAMIYKIYLSHKLGRLLFCHEYLMYDLYLCIYAPNWQGKLGIGRLTAGMLKVGDNVGFCKPGEPVKTGRVS